MSATAGGVEQAAIQQYCKALRTPTIGTQFAAMAEQAQRGRAHLHAVSGSLAGDGS